MSCDDIVREDAACKSDVIEVLAEDFKVEGDLGDGLFALPALQVYLLFTFEHTFQGFFL